MKRNPGEPATQGDPQMLIEEARAGAKELHDLSEALQVKRYGRSWTVEELALGFVGDVGDLAKSRGSAAGVPEQRSLRAVRFRETLAGSKARSAR